MIRHDVVDRPWWKRLIKGASWLFAAWFSSYLDQAYRRSLGLIHGTLAIGAVICIVISFGAALQFVIEFDYRTVTRAVVCVASLFLGIALAFAQHRLYRGWEDQLE